MSEQIALRAEVNRLVKSDPFQPFVLVMVSGDRYGIDHPEEIVVGEEAITVVPIRRGGYSILRFNQVSSVDVSEPR